MERCKHFLLIIGYGENENERKLNAIYI